MRRGARKRLHEPKVVTFRRDAHASSYGTLACSWEESPREELITLAAGRKFAEGFDAEFETEAAW